MKSAVAVAPPPLREPASTSASLLPLVGIGADGLPLVQVDADTLIVARLAVRIPHARLSRAVAEGRLAVVVYEDGDRLRPIVVGLLEPPLPAAPAQNESDAREDDGDRTGAGSRPPVIEADADGTRVRLTARDEIVLQCGRASITLRRNGRVIIHGTYVETRSEGTNRIKGGQVQIN